MTSIAVSYAKAARRGRLDSTDAALYHGLVKFYLSNAPRANNWDLVDVSAKVLGDWLVQHPDDDHVLDTLAASSNLWERRLAVVATHSLIKEGSFAPTLRVAAALLGDEHDLIHKAVGWMLREVGKRDKNVLVCFLDEHIAALHRTTLAYATEKFAKSERQQYRQLRASGGEATRIRRAPACGKRRRAE